MPKAIFYLLKGDYMYNNARVVLSQGARLYVCMYVCMYVRTYVRTYVCMYVFSHMGTYHYMYIYCLRVQNLNLT